MTVFDEYKRRFDADDLGSLTQTPEGLLWLKLKSIARSELLESIWKEWNLPLTKGILNQTKSPFSKSLEDTALSHQKIDDFIRRQMSLLPKEVEERLVSELYKVQFFDWGGDYKNALDKYLIDRYVKEYSSFDTISHKLETEIPRAVYGYVICSWYNHWSTILIENLFKKHPKVLPAIGNIKKVDFFIDDIPFDLKVTYLPVNFIEKCRKESGLKSEISELKATAKQLGLVFDNSGRQKDVHHELVERLKDSVNPLGKQTVDAIYSFRQVLTQECIKNPKPLIQNLYEEQGEMRFDASNRLFLILVDEQDFESSWKLKRNVELLTKTISAYLDSFDKSKVEKMTISFSHKAKNGMFHATSDAIFIVRNQ
jgi:hypothetical protein